MPLKATDETRRIVKKPIGILVKDEAGLRSLLKGFKGRLVSVGDIVSEKLLDLGFNPSLCVVDGKTMRTIFPGVKRFKHGRKLFTLVNPPGTVSEESWRVFKEALASAPSTILVEGEEDLLTIVAVKTVSKGSLVLYGQPGEGVVVVKVDESSKKLIQRILETMEPSE
ncbi:MAG: GTP-dependent dephospho-CoA kinase family protein [Thermoproteota archaeon]